ncbi:MAG: MFS transporter [Candidatus Cloacimonetes bacterium]|nr:MFS transporter [Candidatus Cloacimonadota bacterium]
MIPPGAIAPERPLPVPRMLINRPVTGWVMYDFANSAYAVVILAVIFNVWFAEVIAGGEAGTVFHLFGRTVTVPGVTVFSFVNSIALVLVAVASPLLGALADFSGRKRRYLAIAWMMGVLSTGWISFFGAGDLLIVSVLFILSNLGFAGGSVFYDAFLPEVSERGTEGRVSGLGYAAGYLGGGLLLVLIFVLKSQWPQFDFRWSFALTSLWWLIFAIPTFLWLPRKEPRPRRAGELGGYLKIGFRRVWHSLKHMRRLHTLRWFLLAYLIYGTGIETVIRLTSIFGAVELGMQQQQLVLFFLVIQGTALVGAMLFGWLADRFSNRRSLAISLSVWVLVLVWAWFLGVIWTPIQEFWLLGILAGVAMGGSQGVSRSLQSVILPEGMESEFFGFFTMSGRLANILGMLTFGVVTWITGDMRTGIVSLLVFFVLGLLLLVLVSERRGRGEARQFLEELGEA